MQYKIVCSGGVETVDKTRSPTSYSLRCPDVVLIILAHLSSHHTVCFAAPYGLREKGVRVGQRDDELINVLVTVMRMM